MQRFLPRSERSLLVIAIATAALSSIAIGQTNPGQTNPHLADGSVAAERVIANGNPPLTDAMVSRFVNLLCWSLEIPNESTTDQITNMALDHAIRNMMVQDWKTPTGIKQDLDFLNWQGKLARMTPEEREFIRISYQREVVKAAQTGPGKRESRQIIAAYDGAHPVIAAGSPALTRQAADAFTGYVCFTEGIKAGRNIQCPQAVLDKSAQNLAQQYPTMTPLEQKDIAELPLKLAFMRWKWATSSEPDRQKLRAQWLPASAAPAQDPLWAAAYAAAERANAFAKKDPLQVTEQELHAAGKDATTAARECGRTGSPAYDLKAVAYWEQLASQYNGDLSVYRHNSALRAADAARQRVALNQALIRMQMQNQQMYNNQLHDSLNAVNMQADANGRNIAAHVNDSPSDWVVRRAP